MESILLPAEELDHDDTEMLQVHAWRTEQLRRLGLHRIVAEMFADLVDWHALAELVDRGYPPEVALEIVR